jgi:uncharacterized protein YbaP (TraB family)
MGATKVSHGSAILCLFAILSSSANAAPAPSKSSGGKHCLWRITNAKAPVYLLGSVHKMRSGDYPLAAAVEQAIQQSQQFYFEIDPKRDDEFGRKLKTAAKLPHGVQIKDKIHAKTWDYLSKSARGGGTNWMNLKAWAIAMFVLEYPLQERLSTAFGLDNYVEKKARARGRPMRGLESVDDHIGVFSGMSDLESEACLLEAIVYASETDARTREMMAAWKAGNTDRLFALEMPDLKDVPGLNPRLLGQRNARWIPVIEKAIQSGAPTLIVAGAMHFSGPNSVLNMLRAKGYQIEQL